MRAAFSLNFPNAEVVVEGFDVASGVPAQPWGEAITRQGALQRAVAACEAWSAPRVVLRCPDILHRI